MKLRNKLGVFSAGISLSIFMMTNKALAASAALCTDKGSTFLGFPTWYKYLNPSFIEARDTVVGDKVLKTVSQCNLNANFPEDLGKVGLAIVEILLRLGGLIAVAFVVYGGFKYITSQGEPDKTKNARQTIINSMIGLVISIIATAAVAFIGKEFIK